MPYNESLPHAFRLAGSPDASLVFAAPTQKERDAWIQHLSTAVQEAQVATSADGRDGRSSLQQDTPQKMAALSLT